MRAFYGRSASGSQPLELGGQCCGGLLQLLAQVMAGVGLLPQGGGGVADPHQILVDGVADGALLLYAVATWLM